MPHFMTTDTNAEVVQIRLTQVAYKVLPPGATPAKSQGAFSQKRQHRLSLSRQRADSNKDRQRK